MVWKLEKAVYFSLGRYCATAFHLKRLGINHEPGPLDWMGSDVSAGLTDILRNRFRGFMALENLLVIDQHQGKWVVVDQRYLIRSAHGFPIECQEGVCAESGVRSIISSVLSWYMMLRYPASKLMVKASTNVSVDGLIRLC